MPTNKSISIKRKYFFFSYTHPQALKVKSSCYSFLEPKINFNVSFTYGTSQLLREKICFYNAAVRPFSYALIGIAAASFAGRMLPIYCSTT